MKSATFSTDTCKLPYPLLVLQHENVMYIGMSVVQIAIALEFYFLHGFSKRKYFLRITTKCFLIQIVFAYVYVCIM